MTSHALETLALLFLFNVTSYTEDRRGSAARPGPGMGGICPNGRIISFGL